MAKYPSSRPDRELAKFKPDLNDDTCISIVTGETLKDLYGLVDSSGLISGETYDAVILIENPTTENKGFYFFSDGVQLFSIIVGVNASLDRGLAKFEPTDNITQLVFFEGANFANSDVGTDLGILFAIGGANVTYSIVSDPSGLFVLNGNILESLAPIPEGVYPIVVKATGTGTEYINLLNIEIQDEALISKINLSSNSVPESSPVGTVVGALSTLGGQEPITYSIISQKDSLDQSVDIFEIDGASLKTKDDVGVSGSFYSLSISAEDNRSELPDSERFKVEQFIIEVTAVDFEDTNSLDFNGIDETMSIPDSALFRATTALSVSFWIKVDAFPLGNEDIFSQWDGLGNNRNFACRYNINSRLELHISNDGAVNHVKESDLSIGLGLWHHVVMQFDVNKARIYLDGVLAVGTEVFTASSRNNAQIPLAIASSKDNVSGNTVNYFDGLVNELAFYDTYLSDAEITEIYNSGLPNDLQSNTSAASLVEWWRMGENYQGGSETGSVQGFIASGVNMNNSNKSTDVPV